MEVVEKQKVTASYQISAVSDGQLRSISLKVTDLLVVALLGCSPGALRVFTPLLPVVPVCRQQATTLDGRRISCD